MTHPTPPTPNELAKAFVNKKLSIDLTKTPEDVFAAYWKLKETEPIGDSELEIAVTTVLEENPNAVDKYRVGEEQVLGFFMGQIIRKIGKKVDPQLVRATLIEKLTETMGE